MTKITWKPGTLEYPLPPAMISCGTLEHPNIMTAAWTGIVNSEPPMTYVSIRSSRHSHSIIKESGEFVINLTTEQLVAAADLKSVGSNPVPVRFRPSAPIRNTLPERVFLIGMINRNIEPARCRFEP